MANQPDSKDVSAQRTYWAQEIASAKKRFITFHKDGDDTVDAYRSQKSDYAELKFRDKYNILYSSTETMRPNLYAQEPKVRVALKNPDQATEPARLAVRLLEGALSTVVKEQDFDEIMENCVEDLILPGMGCAWVRYEPRFADIKDKDGLAVNDEQGEPSQELIDELVCIEHTYWQDMLFGLSRGWKTVPWGAKRLFKTKEETAQRWGKDKAAKLTYAKRDTSDKDAENTGDTAEIWEIWDKRTKTAYWYAESYPGELLDQQKDPLRLKKFFPFPRPMRAISNTRSFVPRAYYSQYKAQHETLNVMTMRIRLLGEALRVVGVYDGSNPQLANLLNPNAGNKMIAIDSWAMFAQSGGIKGNVEWLPLDQIVTCLVQLQAARETAKQEIYEITGFSDIIRGVSKASETLGAQNIKSNWAGARIKKIQREVQRFARDIIALAGEVLAEHCSPETIAKFSSLQMPDPAAIQTDPNAQAAFKTLQDAFALLSNDASRISQIDIETDSTLLADEESDRKDRTDFLAAAGAFLQQSVPAMEKTPELGPLLGAMLMFVVRTFPTSRDIEQEFEKVQNALANKPPAPPPPDPTAAATAVAQVKAGTDTALMQSNTAQAQAELAAKTQVEQQKIQVAQQAEANRHTEAMHKLDLEDRKIRVAEAELQIKQQMADTAAHAAQGQADTAEQRLSIDAFNASHKATMDVADHEHGATMDVADHEHQQNMDVAGLAQENDRMDREDAKDAKTDDLTGEQD